MSTLSSAERGLLTRPLTHRLIQYCTNTRDFMVPSLWGSVSFQISIEFVHRWACRLQSLGFCLSCTDHWFATSRLTSAKTHMHHNNLAGAVQSCKAIPYGLSTLAFHGFLHRSSTSRFLDTMFPLPPSSPRPLRYVGPLVGIFAMDGQGKE